MNRIVHDKVVAEVLNDFEFDFSIDDSDCDPEFLLQSGSVSYEWPKMLSLSSRQFVIRNHQKKNYGIQDSWTKETLEPEINDLMQPSYYIERI